MFHIPTKIGLFQGVGGLVSKKRASELVCKRDAIDKEGESTQGVYVTTGQERYPYSVNCV